MEIARKEIGVYKVELERKGSSEVDNRVLLEIQNGFNYEQLFEVM